MFWEIKESASFQVQPGHVILPFHLAPLCFTFHCKAINRICPDYYSFRGSYGIHHLSKLCNVHLKKIKFYVFPRGDIYDSFWSGFPPVEQLKFVFPCQIQFQKRITLGRQQHFIFVFEALNAIILSREWCFMMSFFWACVAVYCRSCWNQPLISRRKRVPSPDYGGLEISSVTREEVLLPEPSHKAKEIHSGAYVCCRRDRL